MSEHTSIQFSRTEYRALVEMIQIADWVISSHETEPLAATQVFRDVRAKVLGDVEKMGMGHLIEHSPELNDFFETREYEETSEHREFINNYDDCTFWDNLVDNLAKRDLIDHIGKKHFIDMEPMTRFQRLERLQEKYEREFEANGLQNLRAVD